MFKNAAFIHQRSYVLLHLNHLRDTDPKYDLTSADGDSGAAWMKMDYSSEPITPSNLSSSSPERREADTGIEDRQTGETARERKIKWLVTTMTMAREEGDRRELVSPHFPSPAAGRGTSTHPWQTSADKHQRGKRSPRGHGVPPWGKALLNPSTLTHTILILIPHGPLTSLLKHGSKSPDWSQQLRNK